MIKNLVRAGVVLTFAPFERGGLIVVPGDSTIARFPLVPGFTLWMMVLFASLAAVHGADEHARAFPVDYIDSVITDPSLHLTLPNGKTIVGKVERIERATGAIVRAKGQITHPEAGKFSLERQIGGTGGDTLSGTLEFDGQPVIWMLKPVAATGWQWVESPVEDAFRPRQMQLPAALPADTVRSPKVTRDEAEATMRKDLVITPLENGNVRVGAVVVDKTTRSARIPAAVNMTGGAVEYALVTETGKCHESLFSTAAAPRDIHLAMLLLGIKPAMLKQRADNGLIVPGPAAVNVRVEWDEGGKLVTHPMAELVLVMPVPSPEARKANQQAPWLYNGSRFTGDGFAASIEGSIIALMADDMALINNAAPDRADDESHTANGQILPKAGTMATIVISGHTPASPTEKSLPKIP